MADNPPADPASPRATSPSLHRQETSSEKTLDVEQPVTLQEKKEDDGPPDGGYGWVCVACNFFINAFYLNNNYFPDTSALAFAFIGGLSISMAMLIAPLATHIIHLYGTKVCLHLGIFFETLSLIGASFCTKKWQIILAQGLCFGWGMGFLFVGTVGIIPQWFKKKRSVANAIAAAGSGLGGMMYSLITQKAIDTLGLPWAFRILGFCTFVVNITAANLLRDRNRQTGSRHKAFDFGVLKRPEFLLLQGWSYFSMLGYTSVLFSLPAYARSIGLTAQQGSILGAILNLGQMAGRPFIGLASDRWGRMNLATIFSFLCGVCCFAFWIPAEVVSDKMGLLLFFAIVGGALAGTFWATIAVVGAEVVGLPDLPAALSWTWVLMVPPTTVAEPIALELRRVNADRWIYLPPQIFTACMYFGGALCLWVVRGWKIGEMEELEKRRRQREVHQERTGIQKNGKTVMEEEAPLHRVRTASITKASWDGKDLFRRMVAWKNV